MHLLTKALLVSGILSVSGYGTYKVIDTPISNGEQTQTENEGKKIVSESRSIDSDDSQSQTDVSQEGVTEEPKLKVASEIQQVTQYSDNAHKSDASKLTSVSEENQTGANIPVSSPELVTTNSENGSDHEVAQIKSLDNTNSASLESTESPENPETRGSDQALSSSSTNSNSDEQSSS